MYSSVGLYLCEIQLWTIMQGSSFSDPVWYLILKQQHEWLLTLLQRHLLTTLYSTDWLRHWSVVFPLTKCRTSNLIWWCLKHMSYTKCICIFKCPLSWHSFLTKQPLKSMLFSSQWLMLSLSSLEQNGTV